MTITTAAMALADQIEEAISSTRVTQGLLRLIQQQVQAPPGQEECVIESLFRCLISADIQRRYRIPTAEVSRWINSSHLRPRLACIKPQLHEHLQPKDDSFVSFTREHQVDFYETIPGRKPALRRADLFIVAKDGPLSIEFKYLKPQKILNAMACVQQMNYYAHHAASLLVVYAANKRHPRLMEDIQKIRRELNDNARVVLTEGPAVGIA